MKVNFEGQVGWKNVNRTYWIMISRLTSFFSLPRNYH